MRYLREMSVNIVLKRSENKIVVFGQTLVYHEIKVKERQRLATTGH